LVSGNLSTSVKSFLPAAAETSNLGAEIGPENYPAGLFAFTPTESQFQIVISNLKLQI
jgi:hypothetical protein